jgi:Histidine kinase-, DNA gyrase B-, and HSP90-like ATPase
MSKVNIKRAVENIRSSTTVYTPIVEVIVNAIQSIEDKGNIDEGKIRVILKRSPQIEIDGSLPNIESISVTDNGIGFTDNNRVSFDTLYSDHKIQQGGKGFGRFTCLKYFKDLHVDSIYNDSGKYRRRSFSMGKGNDIIVNERVSDSDKTDSCTSIYLDTVRKKSLDKKPMTIARSLVEKLLPYFITKDYICSKITLEEEDGLVPIILNDYISNASAVIQEIEVDENSFSLGQEQNAYDFQIRIFKIYSPKNKVSKISLVADKREVTETSISNYVPEFSDEFYDKRENGTDDQERNYIIKVYVFSHYLDNNVSLERGGFDFQKESDLLYGISQLDIESKAAALTKKSVIDDISVRQEKKKERIISYVEEEAPWHKKLVNNIDLSAFPYNPSNEEIEVRLQKEKFQQEIAIRRDVNSLLQENDVDNFKETISKIVEKISESSKNDLIHYITLRRKVLDLFKKSLEIDHQGEYSSEGALHDIIFPKKEDSESIGYDEHNLWIIDERLNFTSYVSSDLPLNGGTTERPDLIAYDRLVAFRGDNDSSNPVTVFEFKKPDRDDFVNPSSKEDPIKQIVRYVNNIRDGKFKTPKGQKINVATNTPFYGYIICSLTPKVEKWLKDDQDFKTMPDGMGWFGWRTNINLYIEVMSWEKLLKDADMRNKVFFHKLGI